MVFDIGNVLVNWSPYYLYCDKLGLERQAVDRFLKDVDFSNWNKEQDKGRIYAEAVAELSARFPEYSELISAYDEQYMDTISGSMQPVVDIVSRLKSAGYPLYTLSNWSAEKFHLMRPQYPFFDWFDGLVISGDVGLVKPEKEIYEYLLELAGRPAEECLFIDDHTPNLDTARELGFQTILFQSAPQLEAELQRRGILDGAKGSN